MGLPIQKQDALNDSIEATWALKRTVGRWSGGTPIEVLSISDDNETVTVRRIAGTTRDREAFECKLDDIVKRRVRVKV